LTLKLPKKMSEKLLLY